MNKRMSIKVKGEVLKVEMERELDPEGNLLYTKVSVECLGEKSLIEGEFTGDWKPDFNDPANVDTISKLRNEVEKLRVYSSILAKPTEPKPEQEQPKPKQQQEPFIISSQEKEKSVLSLGTYIIAGQGNNLRLGLIDFIPSLNGRSNLCYQGYNLCYEGMIGFVGLNGVYYHSHESNVVPILLTDDIWEHLKTENWQYGVFNRNLKAGDVVEAHSEGVVVVYSCGEELTTFLVSSVTPLKPHMIQKSPGCRIELGSIVEDNLGNVGTVDLPSTFVTRFRAEGPIWARTRDLKVKADPRV